MCSSAENAVTGSPPPRTTFGMWAQAPRYVPSVASEKLPGRGVRPARRTNSIAARAIGASGGTRTRGFIARTWNRARYRAPASRRGRTWSRRRRSGPWVRDAFQPLLEDMEHLVRRLERARLHFEVDMGAGGHRPVRGLVASEVGGRHGGPSGFRGAAPADHLALFPLADDAKVLDQQRNRFKLLSGTDASP